MMMMMMMMLGLKFLKGSSWSHLSIIYSSILHNVKGQMAVITFYLNVI